MSETDQNELQSQKLIIGDVIKNPYKHEQSKTFKPNDKIGPNKVILQIGEGGSAKVYKVWHEGLEVVRAVKVLKQYTNKEARERFLTEAKILADIHHPNIIEIHNIGLIDQLFPFIEMEFVDGISIKSLLSQKTKLPLEVALSITYFICQALHYAHTKDYTLYGNVYDGLIHRDIKPNNIFFSKNGIIKLMDFGIARPQEVSLHTVGAKIIGTMVYLSPEQLNGKKLDSRSDIFSLGTVLYEMITGCRAFNQKTLSELVQKKTIGEYKPIESYGIHIPNDVVTLVNKSMALDPENRFSTAEEFNYELYSVIRSISDSSPQNIVTQYSTNPDSFTNTTSTKKIKSIPTEKSDSIQTKKENPTPIKKLLRSQLPLLVTIGLATIILLAKLLS